MSRVSFATKSRLQKISSSAFSECLSLESMIIPSAVEVLGDGCFWGCTSLSALVFEAGSQLEQMGSATFARCPLLRSIRIPSFVTKLPSDCFEGSSLSVLDFESPSHLTEFELQIPSDFHGTQIDVPNSVIRVRCSVNGDMTQPLVMNFERDSRLDHFERVGSQDRHRARIFARFSEQTLKNRRESPGRALPHIRSVVSGLVRGRQI
jgi:hypothetical protein